MTGGVVPAWRTGVIVVATVAAGTVAGYLALERPVVGPRAGAPAAPATPAHTLPVERVAPELPAAVDAAAPAGRPPAAAPAAGTPAAAQRVPVGDARGGASDPVEARARRLEKREPHARADLRRLLERVLAGKLADRELGPADYERLVDATLRLRAALRVLRGLEPSPATAAVRAAQRDAVGAAFAELEAITGLAPAELGSVIAPDADAAGEGGAP